MGRVTKSTVECYDIRTDRRGEWASITVRDNGQVSVTSDYGNWAYWWTHPGSKGLKHFLTEINDSYLLTKFGGPREHFNGEKSLEEAKRRVLERRRNASLDKAEARAAWEAITTEVDETGSAETFGRSIYEHDSLKDLFDYGDLPIIMEDDPQLVAFVERIWPLFVAELRFELGREVRA